MTQYEALDRISLDLNRGRKYGAFGTATLRVADHCGNIRRFDSDMISVCVLADSIFISVRKGGAVLAERTLSLNVTMAVEFVESFESSFEDEEVPELTAEEQAFWDAKFGR